MTREGLSQEDWQDLKKYIGIGTIPYKSCRYKLFPDEVLPALQNLIGYAGQKRARKIVGNRLEDILADS
jgi:hypothetical protein